MWREKGKQNYAPFGSVSPKNSKAKKKKGLGYDPGPGSYDVSLPLITPVVQTIRKKNNNIIVKLGHMGTPSFFGDERFGSSEGNTKLGPGEYQTQKIENNSPKKVRESAAQQLRKIINPLETVPTISQVKRVSFEDEIEMPSQQQKIREKMKLNNLKGSNWSKYTSDRSYNYMESKKNPLGPGQYELKTEEGKSLTMAPSASFVSRSVRSFFDQIIYQTNMEKKARQREHKKYKSDVIGPGSYEISPSKKVKKSKYQFFGSTEDRKLS